MIVHEQQAGGGIAGDKNVRPPILIQISRYHCHPVAFGRFCDPCLLADIGKRTVAIIAVQRVSSSGHSDRSAFNGYASPVAIRVLSWNRCMLEREAHVIGNEQIEIPIPVVVDETAARPPAWRIVPQSGTPGHVGKRSIAVVAVETVLPEVCAKNILESVIVVIADANRGGPARCFQTGFFRHIGECAVTIVLVKAIAGVRRIFREAGTRQQKNIHPTVVVVVDEGTTTTGGFQNVFLAVHSAVDGRSMESGRGCYIHEMGIEGATRRCWSRLGFDRVHRDPLCQQPRSCGEGRRSERNLQKSAAGKRQGGCFSIGAKFLCGQTCNVLSFVRLSPGIIDRLGIAFYLDAHCSYMPELADRFGSDSSNRE